MTSAEYMRDWRAKKGEEYKIYRREYDAKRYQEKKDEIKANSKKNYYEKWDARQISRNAWNSSHKDEIAVYQAQYYQENKEELIPAMSKRYQENKSKYNKVQRIYKNNKYHTNLNYRIKEAYSSRIRGAIKKGTKHVGTLELLGCTIPELREWIEKKFLPGMTWNNFGEWNIEHIQPCCAFDLTKLDHQKHCFHYLNLRPYWAKDNLLKEKTMDLAIKTMEEKENV